MRLLVAILCSLTSLVVALGPKNPSVRPARGITTYVPATPGVLDGADFMDWVTTHAQNNYHTLAIAKGAYHVTPGSQYAHIFLSSITTGVAIWMDGVNLTMTQVGLQAFQFYLCANLTTYGPTVWWDTPGFSQATITNVTALDTTGQNFNMTVYLDDGYDSSFLLDNSTGGFNGEYTDPTTGRLQAGPGWSTIQGTATQVPNENNTWTVPLTNSYFAPVVGYKILARGTFLFCNLVAYSNNTIINDYTLLNCGGFGWMSNGNTKTTFNSLTIKPASFPPPNGTALPVRASSADGVHSADDYVGPTFDSCLFTALDDDCIAIHGSLNSVSGILPPTTKPTTFTTPSGPVFVGATLKFYSASGLWNPLGTSKVTKASTINNVLTITVASLPAGVDATSSWVNLNQTGSAFSITNTQAGNNRGRGAIIKASNGNITNNAFTGVAYAGLDLGPEFSSWSEADYVSNLNISNNLIDSCNYLDKATSAFMLHGDGDNPITGNNAITISNLTIRNTSASNFYVGATSGVNIQGVQFQQPFQGPSVLWETWPDAVATFENVSATMAVTKQWGCIQGGAAQIGRPGVKQVQSNGVVKGVDMTLGVC